MSAAETSMRRLVVTAPREAAWEEVPIPSLKPRDVLVRVLGVTTCPHWDLHIVDGVPMFPGHELRYPYVPGQPGHEAMGEVAAVGAQVRELRVGQRVAAWRASDIGAPGFYGQYGVCRADDLLPITSSRPPASWASLELAMCVEVSFQRLVAHGGVRGRRVAVAGLGPAGLVAVQLARHHGAAAIVGIDPVPARRALAMDLGASEVTDGDACAWSTGRTGTRAVDVAIDCTGIAAVVEFLLHRTRDAVVLFGVVREAVRYEGVLMWGPGVSLVGYGEHNFAAAQSAAAAIEAGTLDLSALVTTTMPLRDYLRGVELLRRKEAIKVLFDPWA
ncbi:zinc-dependent alcohol dehydrogenase [Congregicoccus parvus]|uniref:zinc-dependent alcohol dehydrogenase n=1 Tax=Congregicoccus parvus TaxID=3081749 RepID=UPI003FA56644